MATTPTPNNKYGLSKPYEMVGEMTPRKMAELDEMLEELYRASTKDETRIEDVEEIVETPTEAEDQIVKTVTVTLSETDIESGNTSPPVLVDAVAGKVIVPLQVLMVVTVTSVYTSSPTWVIRHQGIAGGLTGTNAPSLQSTVTTRVAFSHVTSLAYSSDPTGIALVMFLNANPTGTGSATAKVVVTYYEADGLASV